MKKGVFHNTFPETESSQHIQNEMTKKKEKGQEVGGFAGFLFLEDSVFFLKIDKFLLYVLSPISGSKHDIAWMIFEGLVRLVTPPKTNMTIENHHF